MRPCPRDNRGRKQEYDRHEDHALRVYKKSEQRDQRQDREISITVALLF